MENRQQKTGKEKQENGIIGRLGENLRSLDSGSAPWMVLGFCLPMVGVVLYLAWKGTKEAEAKAAGTGAAISIGISLALYGMMTAAAMLRIIF